MLKDKVALITGGSSGIGEAIALQFAKNGAKIAITYRRNESGARSVKARVENMDSNCMVSQADVTSDRDIEVLIEDVMATFGKIDILINNAGSSIGVPFLEASPQHWLDVISNNFLGAVECSRRCAPAMLERGQGKILNVSSIRGLLSAGREGRMAYSASKAALNNFTATLAKELAPQIQVNAVAPGFVYTPYYEGLDESLRKQFETGSLIRRFVRTEEIAEALLYLACADAVTGHILVVDGGYSLKLE